VLPSSGVFPPLPDPFVEHPAPSAQTATVSPIRELEPTRRFLRPAYIKCLSSLSVSQENIDFSRAGGARARVSPGAAKIPRLSLPREAHRGSKSPRYRPSSGSQRNTTMSQTACAKRPGTRLPLTARSVPQTNPQSSATATRRGDPSGACASA
jgi:hypothetical protein